MEATFVPVEWGFLSPRRPPPKAFEKFDLFKPFDATGIFWQPSDPKQQFSGQIYFIPGDGIRLLINGSFSKFEKKNLSYPVLNGRLAKGTPCTFLSAWGHVNSYGIEPSYFITDLHSETLILGEYFKTKNDIQIGFIDVQFSHIDKWFYVPYDLTHTSDTSESLLCFQPDEASAEIEWLGQKCQINVFCARSIPSLAGTSETKFKYSYRFHLTTKEKQSLSWFLEVVSILRECFIFLIGTGIYTLDLVAWEEYPKKSEDKSCPNQYRIYLGVDVPSLIRTDESLYCTSYNKFKPYFSKFLNDWFLRREDLSVLINTYKETLLNDGAYEETIFLRIVQTLEHLHGLVFPDKKKYCSDSEWESFTAWFQKNVPLPNEKTDKIDLSPEKLSFLNDVTLKRISSLNELTLRSRLENLFEGIKGDCLWPAIDNPSDPRLRIKEIIKETEITRNYLTHYRRKLKKKISTGRDLERNTSVLWGALTYWIGKLLNLPENILSEITFQSTRAMFLVDRKTKL